MAREVGVRERGTERERGRKMERGKVLYIYSCLFVRLERERDREQETKTLKTR